MTESIKVFDSAQFGAIRALSKNGEPWFVAKDVCNVLGIRSDTVRKIVDACDIEETNPNTIGVAGGRSPLLVNEPGFYTLVMRSRKPEAKAFKRWVTHDVLPAIRRDGGYVAAREDESPELIMARALKVAQSTIERERSRAAALEAENDAMRPKALFADAVAASDGTCTVGELAKMMHQMGIDIGQNRLFERLRQAGYLGKQGPHRNVPTQRAMDMGLFRIKESVVACSDGHIVVNRTPKVTGKGQRYFIDKAAALVGGDV